MARMNILRNGKMLRPLVLYACVFAAIWACEEEDEPTVSDPSVSIFFLNQDSLDQITPITDALDLELAAYDEQISELNDQADATSDSLIKYTVLVNEGNEELEADRSFYENQLTAINSELVLVEKDDSTANATRQEWKATVATINSGAVKISSIENFKNGQVIIYEDSSDSWKLPLDMQADDIDLNITIAEEEYNLAMTYKRTITSDEKNKVIIRTSDFKIISTDFNNPSLSCEDCEDIKTTIYVEF